MTAPRQPLDETSLSLLQRETASWVARGLITQEQANAILAGYVAAPPLGMRRWLQEHLIATLSILGAVLIGLGVLLFIGANWQSIPKGIKLGLLFLGLVVTYGGGYWVTDRLAMPRVGAALVFLGVILYGAAIFLIAQMYHVRAGSPSLLLWWSLGALPLAYAVRSRAVLVLGISTSLVTLLWYGALWLLGTDGAPQRDIALASVTGATLLGLGLAKSRAKPLVWSAPIPIVAGTALMLASLYLFTFRGIFDERVAPEPGVSWQFALAFHLNAGAAVVTSLATWLSAAVAGRAERGWLGIIVAGTLLVVGGAYLVLFAPFGSPASYAILFNAAMAAVIIALIVGGYVLGGPGVVNLGVALALLDIVTRYFDFAWRLLDRSLVFIIGGLVLLAFGFILERLRRKVVSTLAERGPGQ